MAFNKIPDYDAVTAGNNIDIGGISIAEGWPATNINNSERELLKQLKRECAYGSTIASASTVDISGIHACRISGTTTITAFTITDGTTRFLTFTGTLTLTHNATSLICPTGANITTVAGDCCIVEGIGSNQARIVNYYRTGTPLDGTSGYVLTAAGVGAAPTFQPALSSVAVRQTVISGPVDSNGLPNFGGSTGSGTVTCTGNTLIATAANGFSATGDVNRTGSITSPSWTSLTTNGTMYLYLDVAADGTCTTGSTTLAPVYQPGGTYSTTSGQFTFNINEMVGKVGNGSTADQTYRVFVGEVTVASNVVSAITWYALNGRYVSATTATLPSTTTKTTFNHNLGIAPKIRRFVGIFTTAQGNYAIGDEVTTFNSRDTGGVDLPVGLTNSGRNSMYLSTANSSAFTVVNASGGANVLLTAANLSYRAEAERGW